MNHPGLDPDTIERILRGDDAGPRKLTRILAAISYDLTAGDSTDEDAAIGAFRTAHAHRSGRPSRRRLPSLVSVKAALIGLMLLLSGGVAMAATAQHLPNPLGNKHSGRPRTPATSDTYPTRHTLAPGPRSADPPTCAPGPSRSRPIPHKQNKAHTTKKPNGKASKNNPRKPITAVRPAPIPTVGARHPAKSLWSLANPAMLRWRSNTLK
jgi:hypothetical protein